MSHGDDQCEQCGGIRAVKSNLCVHCLVKACESLKLQITGADSTVAALIEQKIQLEKQIEDLIWTMFKRDRENAKLRQIIDELDLKNAKEGEDENDRESKNTRKS